MSNQKSIIGRGYIPRGVLAVCLKTNSDTNLGEVEYKIIHDPYERIFEDRRIFAPLTPRRQKLMAVNVLDANTGLTYAVEYKPVNLVCEPTRTEEPKSSESDEKIDFIERTKQIAKELKILFNTEKEISDKCSVIFLSISDNGEGKTFSGSGFVAGSGERIINNICAACLENSRIISLVKCGVMKAEMRKICKKPEAK